MAYPPAYTRTFSFTDYEVNFPGEPKPGDKLDTEYDNVANALLATQNALALIQRADGQLANGSVGVDQLQTGLFDGIADGITDDAQDAADAAAASASAAATSASQAQTSATDAAASAGTASGAAAQAGVSQGIAQTAANDAALSATDADNSADVSVQAANDTAGSVAACEAHVERAFEWAELLTGPVLPAPPGWPEAVDDGMFSSKWWAIRARDYNSTEIIDLGPGGEPDIGVAFDNWDAIPGNDLGVGQTYATWGTPPHTYVLIDRSNPSDPASWQDITGGPGPAGPPNTLTTGSITTGSPGTPVVVTITGTSPNQVLNMTIPQGDTGATGATGATGPAGPAVNLADATGIVGLTTVVGVASTAPRSDSSPALSQAIAPTWTGAHTFNGAVDLAGLLKASGSEGVSGQMLAAQGVGLPPVWRTASGASIDLGWNFSTAVGTANPGSQKMSLNSAVYSAVTVAVFNATAFNNFDANTILSLLQAGNRIYIQQRNDASKAVLYEVTAPGTNLTGYWTIPVTMITQRGTNFLANADLTVVFILSTSASASANPTASVGLTAVNGSATTWMRSDAAPALSQAIAPTWTASHLWNGAWAGAAPGNVALRSGGPVFELANTGAAANGKNWFLYPTSTGLNLDARSDDYSTSAVALSIQRTAAAITSLQFGNATNNPAYNFLGTGVVTTGGVIRGPSGSAGAASYSFTSDPDTGIYSVTGNMLGFATGGVRRGYFYDTGFVPEVAVRLLDGAAGTPALTFDNDTDTGIYLPFSGDMRLVAGGAAQMRVVAGSAMGVRMVTGQFGSQDGTVAAPGIAFENSPGTGIYRAGSNNMRFATGGALAIEIDSAQGVWVYSTFTGITVDGAVTAELKASNGKLRFYGYSTGSAYIQALNPAASAFIPLIIGSSATSFPEGPVSAPSFTTTSARAIKRVTGAPARPRDILSRLRPIMYRLLAGGDNEQLGLIAEEVHDVCPQLSDGKTVAYDRLAILLLAAWQDEHMEAA